MLSCEKLRAAYHITFARIDVHWLYNIAKRYSQQIWAEACGGTEQAVAAYTLLADVNKFNERSEYYSDKF